MAMKTMYYDYCISKHMIRFFSISQTTKKVQIWYWTFRGILIVNLPPFTIHSELSITGQHKGETFKLHHLDWLYCGKFWLTQSCECCFLLLRPAQSVGTLFGNLFVHKDIRFKVPHTNCTVCILHDFGLVTPLGSLFNMVSKSFSVYKILFM